MPSHWVASTRASGVRSAGKPGHGASSTFAIPPSTSDAMMPLLRRGHLKARAVDEGFDSEAREHQPDHSQVIGRHVAHAKRAAGHRRDRDEGADLDVIRTDPVTGRRELAHSVDLEDVAADPPDPSSHGVQGVAEPLDVRLRGRVEEPGGPVGHRGRHDRGLGAGHAGLVQEDVGAAETACELQAVVGVVQGDPGAELAKGQEMGVEPPAADLVAARPGQHGEAGSRQKRRGEEERRPDLRGQPGVGARLPKAARVNRDRVLVRPVDGHAQSPNELDQGGHISDMRHILDHHVAGGQQRRGE